MAYGKKRGGRGGKKMTTIATPFEHNAHDIYKGRKKMAHRAGRGKSRS